MSMAGLLQSSLDANIVTNTLDEDSAFVHDVAWCTLKHIQNNQQKSQLHDVEEENMVNMNEKDPPAKKSAVEDVEAWQVCSKNAVSLCLSLLFVNINSFSQASISK